MPPSCCGRVNARGREAGGDVASATSAVARLGSAKAIDCACAQPVSCCNSLTWGSPPAQACHRRPRDVGADNRCIGQGDVARN